MKKLTISASGSKQDVLKTVREQMRYARSESHKDSTAVVSAVSDQLLAEIGASDAKTLEVSATLTISVKDTTPVVTEKSAEKSAEKSVEKSAEPAATASTSAVLDAKK